MKISKASSTSSHVTTTRYVIDRPSSANPATVKPITAPPRNATGSALPGPDFAASAVRALAMVATDHADVAGTAGQRRTEHVRDSGQRRDDHRQQDRHRDDEHGDPLVLLVEERLGAVLDLGHQEDHALVAWRLGLDELVVVEREQRARRWLTQQRDRGQRPRLGLQGADRCGPVLGIGP